MLQGCLVKRVQYEIRIILCVEMFLVINIMLNTYPSTKLFRQSLKILFPFSMEEKAINKEKADV